MSERLIVQKACLTVLCFVFVLCAQQRQAGEIIGDSVGPSNQGVRNDTSASSIVRQPGAADAHSGDAKSAASGTPVKPQYTMFGVGVGLAERIFYPSAINDFISDVYDEMKSRYTVHDIIGTTDTSLQPLFIAFALRLKFLYNPLPFLGIEPSCRILFAPENLSWAGEESESINLFTYTAGCDLWARFARFKMVTFKAGIGAVYGRGSLTTSGDLGAITYTGACYGMNVLAGADITIKKIAVNIEFLCPIENIS